MGSFQRSKCVFYHEGGRLESGRHVYQVLLERCGADPGEDVGFGSGRRSPSSCLARILEGLTHMGGRLNIRKGEGHVQEGIVQFITS